MLCSLRYLRIPPHSFTMPFPLPSHSSPFPRYALSVTFTFLPIPSLCPFRYLRIPSHSNVMHFLLPLFPFHSHAIEFPLPSLHLSSRSRYFTVLPGSLLSLHSSRVTAPKTSLDRSARLLIAFGPHPLVKDADVTSLVRFEVFTSVTMKNAVFWDITPCGSCKNQRFGGT
jgi:hypothetical protein